MQYKHVAGMLALLFILIEPGMAFAQATETETQPFIIDEKLLAVDADTAAEFGHSLVLSNDAQVLVVSAPLHDVVHDAGDNENQGQVYVYRRSGERWTEAQRLVASDGMAGDGFGFALAIADAPDYTILVGAPNDDTPDSTDLGTAYVFTFDGASWSEQAKLIATDINEFSQDERGTSVAISGDGDTAFIGAPGVGSGSSEPGAVYVFAQSGGVWAQTQKIAGPVSAAATIGGSMTLAGDGQTLFVSGSYAPSGPLITSGVVRVYQRVSDVWTEIDTLVPSDSQALDGFGDAIAVTADAASVLIGAPENEEGKVFVFEESGEESDPEWTEQSVLVRPSGSLYGDFGAAIALDSTGTQAAIGAWLNGSGGIHHFQQIESEWQFVQTIITPDARQEHLGFSIAMSGDASTIIGGARNAHPDTETFDPLGAVYVYKPGYRFFLPGITH